MCLPTEKEEVANLDPYGPHHSLSHQNPGQTPAPTQKLHLGKDGLWLGFSPIKEPCGLLSNVTLSPDLKCEFTRTHKNVIHILTSPQTYYLHASKSRI